MRLWVVIAGLALAACGRTDFRPAGSEGGKCYGNGTCNVGLSCSGSAICVGPEDPGRFSGCPPAQAVLDTAGDHSVTVPAGCGDVRIQLWGAGGGGGGAGNDGNQPGGEGGGGGYSELTLPAVLVSTDVRVVVGGGGAEGRFGTCGSGGGGGGATVVFVDSTLALVAGGGGGGSGAPGNTRGTHGLAGSFGGNGVLGPGGVGAGDATGGTGGYGVEAPGGDGGGAPSGNADAAGGGGGGGAPPGSGGVLGNCANQSPTGGEGGLGWAASIGNATFMPGTGRGVALSLEADGAGSGGAQGSRGADGRAVLSWGSALGGEICGDGGVGSAEECDDGNVVGGDGCDNQCRLETQIVTGDSCALASTVQMVPVANGYAARVEGDLSDATDVFVPDCGVTGSPEEVLFFDLPAPGDVTILVVPIDAFDALVATYHVGVCGLPQRNDDCQDSGTTGQSEGVVWRNRAADRYVVVVEGDGGGGRYRVDLFRAD